jgi:hypothetical protein
VTSILKPGKDPALPSSHRPLVSWTRLAKYLRRSYELTTILHEVSDHGLLRDEQCRF